MFYERTFRSTNHFYERNSQYSFRRFPLAQGLWSGALPPRRASRSRQWLSTVHLSWNGDMKFLHQNSNFHSYSQLGLLSRTGQFNKTNRVWMDVFVRVTATVAGGARSCATETATPQLGAMFNPALPACSGSRSSRCAIRPVVVCRVAHPVG